MKIIGIKYLNENNYKKIRIGHNEILVTGVNHDFNDDTISSKFTDTLKGLDRKHIIDDVKKYVGYGSPSIKVSNNIVPMIESIVIAHNDKVESSEIVRNKILIRTEEFK